MIELEQKYRALLDEAKRAGLEELQSIQLCFMLLSVAGRIDEDCATLLAPHGLSEGRFVILFLLNAAAMPLAPHELATRAGVSRATMTGLLDGIERHGLIERIASRQDRRSITIALTQKGRTLSSQLFRQHGAWIASLFSPLTENEQTMLAHLLNKVAGHLPQGLALAQEMAHA